MSRKPEKLLKAIITLGIISLIAVVFRIWSVFFIAVVLLIGAVIIKRILSVKTSQPSTRTVSSVSDPEEAPYGIEAQVSEQLRTEFPNAKWVWAQSDTKRRIENGDDVYVILNGAGGYRRVKIGISDGVVTGITVCVPTVRDAATEDNPKTDDPAESSVKENYELIAFEWVDAHILELNERINEAIGCDNLEVLIKSDELPVPESWECVCKELIRAGLKEVVCTDGGIKIILKTIKTKE